MVYIKGKITKVTSEYIFIEVGDIGYKLNTYQTQLFKENRVRKVYVYKYVTNDRSYLIGLHTITDLVFFEKLVKLHGVGYKTGLKIMNKLSLDEVRKLISTTNEPDIKKKLKVPENIAKQLIKII